MSESAVRCESLPIELRTGIPYANLIMNQVHFSEALGEFLNISPQDVIAMPGTTGAIEAVRNHVFKSSRSGRPRVLTVCPGYWRARECFEGLGLTISDVKTEPHGFRIDEAELTARARAEEPDLLYLSLPNNPTGAIFNPEEIVNGALESTAILFDLTLPNYKLDSLRLTTQLYKKFQGRKKLFVASSTSKSHNTAESRIGWLICMNSDEAKELRYENRNVVSSVAIQHGLDQVRRAASALQRIEESFELLRRGAKKGRFVIVTPKNSTETVYVLVRVNRDLRQLLAENRIRVMWGSEYGLSDQYIRLETLEPSHIEVFIHTVNA
ncbi:MAG TPA: pyridoxal phosphate-dependent aminotransferase [Candidatus Angelobacter sp.]|jgi:aspartate/methionine/tyrosine aminotransferase